jgi:hypothetical protein
MTRASIRTRYLGPTNHRGARIAVTSDNVFAEPIRIMIDWDHSLSTAENHAAAAQSWLDRHNPGQQVVPPGLSFNGDYFWTWGVI